MKYQEALDLKGLKKEDLSKSIQKKVEELEDLVLNVERFSGEEDLDDEEKDNLNAIRNKIDILDMDLVKSVKKFNLEVQKKRMQVIADLNEAKRLKGESPVPTPSVQETKPVKPVSEPPVEQKPLVLEIPSITPSTPPLAPETQPEDYDDEDLEKYDYTNDNNDDDDDFVPNYEQEEFGKVGEDKPKKMNVGLILMGVGALFLTWGAVNFFKDRK
jgi:hypothetical protein